MDRVKQRGRIGSASNGKGHQNEAQHSTTISDPGCNSWKRPAGVRYITGCGEQDGAENQSHGAEDGVPAGKKGANERGIRVTRKCVEGDDALEQIGVQGEGGIDHSGAKYLGSEPHG